MARPTFNLRLWFALGSFGAIGLIAFALATWMANYLTTSLLERESEVTQEFLDSIVKIDGVAIFRDEPGAPLGPLLIDFSRHIVSMPGIMRANIYVPPNRVLWSTEQQLIGRKFDVNDELEKAFRGERVTEIGTLDSNDPKAEHMMLGQSGHFIEAYIPIRADGGTGAIIAVVELYKYPYALQSTISYGRRMVWWGAAGSALGLFLLLYWIVQRGARIIERQQSNLAQMEAFAAIGQMASAVAHSLRNPMSAIRSSAELWRSELPPAETLVADDVIAEIDRMDGYVRDLLAYTRIEPSSRDGVEPSRVIEAILAKSRPAILRNRIEVSQSASVTRDMRVLGDERLLEQALTSIVTNAVEAMPEGGRLEVSLASETGSGEVAIAISDTGPGIPRELVGRAAESYFTTKSRGLGLGLVLARGIIERFEGRLSIASVPDQGTTVTIQLKSV